VAALEAAALAAAERNADESATSLAVELLRQDPGNVVARRILAQSRVEPPGELRRLTILFCDLVGSTSMSGRHEPDAYHRILQRYHRMCGDVISAHGGTVNQRVGDGVLAVFGHPRSHEDDTARAVRGGLALVKGVAALRPAVEHEFGESLEVRIAIHLGPVHLDLVDSAIYGLVPNVAARLQDLAAPGTVVVSEEVLSVVGGHFEAQSHEARAVKGVDEPVAYHTIARELPRTPGRGRSWHSPFVGRVADRERVRDSVARGVPTVVRGEPGIGKSRLVAEVLGDVGSVGERVTTILCTEYEQTSDFGAASAVLRLDPSAPPEQRRAARLRQLVDDLGTLGLDPDVHTGLLAPLLGLEPSVGYSRPAADLTRVHDQVQASLRAWLGALGARRPMVLRVEDVHWADASTCELLVGLIREPLPGVHLVATERTGQERLHGAGLAVVELAPLSDDESRRLACAVDETLREDRLAATLSRGQGNPLFLEELAREPEATTPVDPELLTRLMNESVVPGALYEPLLARLHASGADIGLAQAAATIGRSFRRDVLAAVVPREPEVLDQGLRSLSEAGLLDAEEDGVHWFRHALMRDVAYHLQPRDQRATMHRRVGDALRARREDGADISWSVVATHYQAAGRIDDAIDGYAFAADDSRERGSMVVGIAHLTTAIDLLEERDSRDAASRLREVDLRLKRGFLCVSTGGNADPRAVADYERCLELIRAEENGPELVGTLVVLWGYHTARGDLARADGLLDDIMATGVTEDPVMLAENRTARGMVRFFQGDFVSSEEQLRLAAAGVPDAVQDTRPPSPWQFPNDPVAVMHVQCGLAAWQRGNPEGFHEQCRRARVRADALPRPHGPFNLAHTLTYQAWVLTEVGEYGAAADCIEELLEIAGQYGFDFWTLAGTTADAITRARAALAVGSAEDAVLLEQADRLRGTSMMTQMIDSKLLLPYGLTAQADLVATVGDHEQALGLFAEALAVADETGSRFYRAETLRLRARTRRALGDDDGIRDLDDAVAVASAQGSLPFELRARFDLAGLGHRSARLDALLADEGAVVASGIGRHHLQSPAT
jgi:class 3 adenylate cyclase/tetratricopeptide (TPR) repeat protein